MEKVLDWAKTDPDKTVLFDTETDKEMSYRKLDELTSRIYAYLKDRGIGRENFVMIDLPRGIDVAVAAIGVWRAGAAYVIVEEGTPDSRKEFIYQDCGCGLLIDGETYAKMLKTPGKEGYEETELHDAAYVIYTSGTTGNPKGVIHEYGTLEENLAHFKYDGKYLLDENDIFLLVTPISFIAGTMVFNLMPYLGVTLIVAPVTAAKDPAKILECMTRYRITSAFFTASYLRLDPVFHPELRTLIISSEPLENVYRDDVTIYNTYAQSETGYLATIFKTDRAYERTPVGIPRCPGRELLLLDEKGKKVPAGEAGEICFQNPYFRGYMNLPEETEKAFRGGIYHSGDLGKQLPDGSLMVLGRIDDMIKVNGNRVEPGEIEKVMKDVLGLSWAAVKVFTDNGSISICGYYTDDIALNTLKAKRDLSKRLPYYMIPNHFIKLERIPINANGKLSRKDLPRPDLTRRTAPYVKPKNGIEECICKAAESVLGIESVGALDDLYALGLDSISAIKLVVATGLKGFTVSLLFRGLTPREIAKIYQYEISEKGEWIADYLNAASKEEELVKLREMEEESRKRDHPLLLEERAAFDWQLNAPHSTMNNYPFWFRLGDDVDLMRLSAAIEKVLKAHGVFSTVLRFNEDGDLVMRYEPDTDKRVVVEKISEAELVDLREHLVRYYKLIGSPLFRFRIFETESGGYLFFDIHHFIADGSSKAVLFRDISDSYEGKPVKEDLYYANLSRLEEELGTETYEKAKEYYEQKEREHVWSRYPKMDGPLIIKDLKYMSFLLPVYEDGFDKIMELYSIGKNAFMIAAAALSLAAYNDAKHLSFAWVYHNRESAAAGNIFGMLARVLTVYVDLKEGMTLKSFLEEIREQLMIGISYSCYPHANVTPESDLSLCVIYQPELGGEEQSTVLGLKGEELPNPFDCNEALIDMEIYDTEEGTEIVFSYLPHCYKEESMNRFRRMVMKSAALLVQYAKEPDRGITKLLDVIKEDRFVVENGRNNEKD